MLPPETSLDARLVTWVSPDDPENPKNWPQARKWRATVSVSAFVLMNTLSSTIIAPALPYISETLNVTNSAEQILILSIFVLGFAFGPFIACPLSEIHGRSRTIQSWNFLYLVFNTVCGPVNSKAAMLILRFLAGFFCSASQGIGSGILSDLFTAKERGRAVAVYSIMPLIGPVIGPIVGGVIARYTTWRWAFYAASLLDVMILRCVFRARASPYSKSSLSHLPQDASLAEIPLTDSDEFWKRAAAQDTNVLTGPFVDGLVMRSADSTSEPKTVYWTRDEFHRILSRKAEIMSKQSGIIPGDRIANLSHMGGMYEGFMFTNQALMEMPTDNVHLPISGQMPHDFTADSIDKFKATVMISTVYATTKLASWLKEQGRTFPSVRLILFMGEAFFKDVRDQWTKAFPSPPIGPYIYGSVECGLLSLRAWPMTRFLVPCSCPSRIVRMFGALWTRAS
ncbi:polyamine transporter 3 [Fusarium flagelliforme]|uniref:Polyamine transporter 3 n=1 Tax=Fusarium flagelliforme TaxID=2675880 RepID=A0A395MY34_9HYPO|nr:polyamine transporter 3 [Fusarium flagelliforme]